MKWDVTLFIKIALGEGVKIMKIEKLPKAAA